MVLLGYFLPYSLLRTPKLQIWKIYKQRDIILSHIFTTNEDHMMYELQSVTYIFDPPTLKIELLKKNEKKKSGDIIILQWYITNDNHIIYGSWDMQCNRNKFLLFGAWKYFHFKVVYQGWQWFNVWLLRYGVLFFSFLPQ